jgi:uncharacterized membrane protein
MIQNIILAAILIVAFFMCISAYFLGLKHGKQLGNNQIPNINLNPTKPIFEAIQRNENKKKQDELMDELTDIMSADKESMLKALKEDNQ